MNLAMNRNVEEQAALDSLQLAEGMSEDDILREKLPNHLKGDVRQVEVAKALGFGPSALNMYLKGTYKSPEKIRNALKGYFKTRGQQEGAIELPELAATTIYEEVTAVVGAMSWKDKAPTLQFTQAHRGVGARNTERLDDLVGAERLGRKIKKRVDLANRTVDAPAAPHFAEVQHESLNERGKFHDGRLVSDFRNF